MPRSRGRACDDVRDYHPALGPWGVTPREAEVARLVAAGYSNPEIVDELRISLSTVKANVARLFRRLDVRSRGVLAGEVSRIVREYREEREKRRRVKSGGLRVVRERAASPRRAAGDAAPPTAPG